MPTLVKSDFQHIGHKEGNVFFNQHTGKLDVRGGNFLSRLVTWMKSKYNPSKINKEYKEAADAFIKEIEQLHNRAFRKYHKSYQISEDHLDKLYELSKQSKPLASRQVRQVLKRLEIVPSALELAENFSSSEYCREQLTAEISRYPELSGPYMPSKIETEKLSSRVKGVMMEEICRQEGAITEEMASSIAQKVVAEYVASRMETLKIVFKSSSFEYCQEKVAEGLSKHPEFYRHYHSDPRNIEKLDLNIKGAIVDASLRQKEEITQRMASSIAEKVIAEHTKELIEAMGGQKVNAATKLMARAQGTSVEKETEEHAEQFAKQIATEKAAIQAVKKSAVQADVQKPTEKPTKPTAKPKTDNEKMQTLTASDLKVVPMDVQKPTPKTTKPTAKPKTDTEKTQTLTTPGLKVVPTDVQKPTPKTTEPIAEQKKEPMPVSAAKATPDEGVSVGKKKHEQFLEKVKNRGLNLPNAVKEQIRDGKINSMSKLTKANNQYIAHHITKTSIRNWYGEKYPKAKDNPPREMAEVVLSKVQNHIESMPNLVNHRQARAYAEHEITGYIRAHSK